MKNLPVYMFLLALLVLGCQRENPSGESLNGNGKFTVAYVDSLLDVVDHYLSSEQTIPLARNDLKLAYDVARALNYEPGIIRSCHQLGSYYLSISDNANSTLYFYLMLRETELAKDSSKIANAHTGLGLVMYNMSKWKDALNYFNQAQVVLESIGSDGRIWKLVGYLKGLCLMNLKQYEDAEYWLTKSHQRARTDGDSMRMFETALALNRIRVRNAAGPEVFAEFDRIQAFFESKDEQIGVCYALQGKANLHLALGDGDAAHQHATKALEMAHELALINPVSEILTTVIEVEKFRGNYQSAFNYQHELDKLRDSTNSIEVATQIAMLGASHQFEKKEAQFDAEIESKNRQQRFFFLLFIGTLLFALVIVYMLRLVAKQRRKSDVLLRNILPEETIAELSEKGHSVPKAHENVTIVFADVVSFTKIASTLQPDTLVRILDKYFIHFDAIIEKHGLEKIKTIGDAYMFVSGLIPSLDSTQKAAYGSLEMIRMVQQMRAEMQSEFGIDFQFRFGMHTGNVVSGVVGDIKYAFDIWGDAVNIAARMEELSAAGKINMSAETRQLLKDRFHCVPRGSFDIKNSGQREMYYLEGELSPSDTP